MTDTAAEPLAYLKGEFVPASQCVLPAHDLGIVLGAAVTDFLRTFHQRPFRMDQHIRRFYRSCRYARIEPPVSFEESRAISERLIRENSQRIPGGELGLVYFMSAGENAIYSGAAGISADLTPSYIQHTFPLPFSVWRNMFLHGVHCVTPAPRHWPPQCLSSKIKHRNRLHMWIATEEARQSDPDAIPLLLDLHGNVTETVGSNFVIYRDGQVVSPRRHNILWGESLTVLTELLRGMDIPFIEDDLQTFDIISADEAWLPSTPYCLAPVTRINGCAVGDGVPGPLWRQLLDRWSQLVEKNVYQEVTGHSCLPAG